VQTRLTIHDECPQPLVAHDVMNKKSDRRSRKRINCGANIIKEVSILVEETKKHEILIKTK
jgi:hypothetical protein